MIDNNDFERIWEQAATRGATEALAGSYPGWLARRRRMRQWAMGSVTCCVLAVALWAGTAQASKPCDGVRCNRTGYSDTYWVEVAQEMLGEM